MIVRELHTFLRKWKNMPSRLPLILRGARQVGKTTLVNAFGQEYDNYLYFNLENQNDLRLFKSSETDVKALVQLLFLTKNIKYDNHSQSLIFIDEVQELPTIIESLRYFHEYFPDLHVIVSGSMLEFALNGSLNMPVGRVEFAELGPLSFKEFLNGMGKDQWVEAMQNIPLVDPIVDLIQQEFQKYAMIGGMPMIVNDFSKTNDIVRAKELYNSIIEAYKSDVLKYAKSNQEANIIRDVLDVVHTEIDNRINLSKFGKLPYKSTDIKIALQKLELARWIQIKYPTTQSTLPLMVDKQKRPRLHFLDVGLINYQLNVIDEYITIQDLDHLSIGSLVQQVVSQELQTTSYLNKTPATFWVREQKGTTSEVDIVIQHKQKIVPIEVKAGATGRLRSLHEFIDRCPHNIGVRLYNGHVSVENITTRSGKTFRLLNLPHCLASQVPQYLDWMETL